MLWRLRTAQSLLVGLSAFTELLPAPCRPSRAARCHAVQLISGLQKPAQLVRGMCRMGAGEQAPLTGAAAAGASSSRDPPPLPAEALAERGRLQDEVQHMAEEALREHDVSAVVAAVNAAATAACAAAGGGAP